MRIMDWLRRKPEWSQIDYYRKGFDTSQTWPQRLMGERAELAGRLERLERFLRDGPEIAVEDESLLDQQRRHMADYLRILDRRLERL